MTRFRINGSSVEGSERHALDPRMAARDVACLVPYLSVDREAMSTMSMVGERTCTIDVTCSPIDAEDMASLLMAIASRYFDHYDVTQRED